jgi:LemA protein
MIIWIIIAIVTVVALYIISTYNSFVATKTRISAGVQEIGNQLKRQADLIPNLESSAKAYLKHEKDIFEKLVSARKAVEAAVKSNDAGKLSTASDKIQELLGGLKVIVESNPQLKGADVIQDLMNELRDTADKVMYSRRTLIDLTADYNTMVVTFPSSLIASQFGFKSEAGLETPTSGAHLSVSEAETKTPKVKLE